MAVEIENVALACPYLTCGLSFAMVTGLTLHLVEEHHRPHGEAFLEAGRIEKAAQPIPEVPKPAPVPAQARTEPNKEDHTMAKLPPGAPRQRAPVTCSKCGETGHNALGCQAAKKTPAKPKAVCHGQHPVPAAAPPAAPDRAVIEDIKRRHALVGLYNSRGWLDPKTAGELMDDVVTLLAALAAPRPAEAGNIQIPTVAKAESISQSEAERAVVEACVVDAPHPFPQAGAQAAPLDPRWQRKRLEILSRDGWTCSSCGATDRTLHVHHGYYEAGAEPWDYPDDSLHTLCEACHEIMTVALKILRKRVARLTVDQVVGLVISLSKPEFVLELSQALPIQAA